MKNSYFIIPIVLNIVLSIFYISTLDTKIVVSYVQQSDINVTETPVTAATKKLNYCYDSTWGTKCEGDGQFLRPHDIVFDSKDFCM